MTRETRAHVGLEHTPLRVDVGRSTSVSLIPVNNADPLSFLSRDPPVSPSCIKNAADRARQLVAQGALNAPEDHVVVSMLPTREVTLCVNWARICEMNASDDDVRNATLNMLLDAPTIAKLYHATRMVHRVRSDPRNRTRVFTLSCGSLAWRSADHEATWLYSGGGFLHKRCESLDDFLNMVPRDEDDPMRWEWHVWITEHVPEQNARYVHDMLPVIAVIPMGFSNNKMQIWDFLKKAFHNGGEQVGSGVKHVLPDDERDAHAEFQRSAIFVDGVSPDTLEREYGVKYDPAAPRVQAELFSLFAYVYGDKIPDAMRTVLHESAERNASEGDEHH